MRALQTRVGTFRIDFSRPKIFHIVLYRDCDVLLQSRKVVSMRIYATRTIRTARRSISISSIVKFADLYILLLLEWIISLAELS